VAAACGFALAGIYAAWLRTGRRLRQLGYAQLLFDQLTWTVLVYVSGGANSGATSLYGLTVLTGAIIDGLPAAALAAAVGYLEFLALCVLMATRSLPPPPDQVDVAYATSLAQIVYPVGLNLIVIVVVTFWPATWQNDCGAQVDDWWKPRNALFARNSSPRSVGSQLVSRTRSEIH